MNDKLTLQLFTSNIMSPLHYTICDIDTKARRRLGLAAAPEQCMRLCAASSHCSRPLAVISHLFSQQLVFFEFTAIFDCLSDAVYHAIRTRRAPAAQHSAPH